MFALLERNAAGEMHWIADADTYQRARLLAIMLSKANCSVIAVVENQADGQTAVCQTYKNGGWIPTITT